MVADRLREYKKVLYPGPASLPSWDIARPLEEHGSDRFFRGVLHCCSGSNSQSCSASGQPGREFLASISTKQQLNPATNVGAIFFKGEARRKSVFECNVGK